jgi:hypothetical protein
MKRLIGWMTLAAALPLMGAIAGCEEQEPYEEEETEVFEEEGEQGQMMEEEEEAYE